MLFMVIERFQDNDMLPIYKRIRDRGRMLPEGLKYVDSWIESNFSRCFQLMECDDALRGEPKASRADTEMGGSRSEPRLFQQWLLELRGSGVTMEFIPVVPSKDTREVVAPHLDTA